MTLAGTLLRALSSTKERNASQNLSALRVYETTALELTCVGSKVLTKDMCDVGQSMG